MGYHGYHTEILQFANQLYILPAMDGYVEGHTDCLLYSRTENWG